MVRALIAAILLFFISGIVATEEEAVSPVGPQVTGFMVVPGIIQCKPVRISFTITNETDKPIYSQHPCAGTTYNLYQSFQDRGFVASPDRYMVGISLNGGLDGYPYRWGFRGPLGLGRSARMIGFLSLIEVGTYDLTASLLLGDTPLGPVSVGTVKVCGWETGKYSLDPLAAKPIYPIVNGQRLPKMVPFMQDGYMLLPIKPLVLSMGANLDFVENSAVISKQGLEIALFPESQQVLVNGIPVEMPVPVHIYNGITYAPIRCLSPLLGQTFYYYSDTRVLFLDGPSAQ